MKGGGDAQVVVQAVAIVAGIVGGLLSGLILKATLEDRRPRISRLRRWTRSAAGGRSCWPQACRGGYARWSGADDRGAAEWTRKKTESPGRSRSSNLTSRLTTARLKPPFDAGRVTGRAEEPVIDSAAISAR